MEASADAELLATARWPILERLQFSPEEEATAEDLRPLLSGELDNRMTGRTQ